MTNHTGFHGYFICGKNLDLSIVTIACKTSLIWLYHVSVTSQLHVTGLHRNYKRLCIHLNIFEHFPIPVPRDYDVTKSVKPPLQI